ncbi:MAG: hypothetical protein LWY06_10055, partial [Firmicutes bacterium]|nr:hypothetical protein [Bacillota bacterium]
LADLAGKNQNKLIGEQFFPFFSSNGDCARVSYAVESKLMHSAGRIFFVNHTDKGVMMFEIIYDSAKEKIYCGNIRQFPVNILTLDYNYLYGFDPKQKYIFDTEFGIAQIEPFVFSTYLDNTPYSGFNRKYHSIGSISVTDHDKIFIQSDSNDMSLLSYYKNPSSQLTREIKFGKALYPEHNILYHPSDFNADEDKVAFYSYFFQDETTQDSINAWLCTWDLKTNKAEKIMPYRPRLIFRPGSLKWGKGKRQDCVALCAEDYVDIIDTLKHTRIAKLKIGLPVKVCWSPDGSKLAVSSRGEIYCYDLDNKQLITVSNENNDNEGYDCFWVK